MEGIGLDFVAGPGNRETLAQADGIGGKTLVTGVVDGRNVWRSDLRGALSACASLLGLAGALVVSTSCSLLHVPLDVRSETTLPPELAGRWPLPGRRSMRSSRSAVPRARAATASRRNSPPPPMNGRMRARLDALGDGTPAAERRATRARGLPVLPTITIGSFPQTEPVRKARADHKAGRIDDDAYEGAMRAETDRVIELQEDIGLDVLVHGEPERNDMVQYFAERLDGFAATKHG